MVTVSSTSAGRQAALRPRAPGGSRLPAIVEFLLAFIASLLGRPRHEAAQWDDPWYDVVAIAWDSYEWKELTPAPIRVRTPQDGTLVVSVMPLLYLFGTRRNRGMRAHARAVPIAADLRARFRAVRAPPGPGRPSAPQHHRHPGRQPHLADRRHGRTLFCNCD